MAYNLRKGDRGQEVKNLQSRLCGLEADGIFGSKTDAAVRDYQSAKDLAVDGIAGKATQTALGMPVYPGIDVSSHNGEIDWQAVSNSGVRFAWIKHTEGRTHENPRHEENLLGARANNVVAGAYHFARPDTDREPNLGDAITEAKWFLSHYDAKPGDLVPMLDLENGMKTDDTYNAHWALAWLETVEAELGHKPICYTARWAEDMYLVNADKTLLEELKEYPVWVASYNSGIEPERPSRIWSGWNVWQYTGSGAVPGVEGNCDKNWMSGGMLDYLRMY